jgi:hypothetical protein
MSNPRPKVKKSVSFADCSSDSHIVQNRSSTYENMDDIDSMSALQKRCAKQRLSLTQELADIQAKLDDNSKLLNTLKVFASILICLKN